MAAARPAAPAGSTTRPSVCERQPHRLDHQVLVDGDHVIEDAGEEGNRLGNRLTDRDPVGDRVGRLRRDGTALAPREHHGRGALGHDADDPRRRRMGLEPGADARREGPIADRHEHGIDRLGPAQQLDGDRAGPGGDLGLAAILDEPKPGRVGPGPGRVLGGVEVVADQPDLRPDARIRSTLIALAVSAAKITTRTPRERAA